MSHKSELLELARTIELALEPDRALDWAIHLRHGLDGVGAYGAHPCYTSSVDAAMKLVQPGYDYILEHVNGGLTIGVRLGHNDPAKTAWGQTDAMAFCIAALRAEAALL